jgi:succinate dehydrogenase / fumarate reductase membrane anchor subunit
VRVTFTGLRAWLVQRASAVYMLFFIIFFLVHFAVDPPHSYPVWRTWMTSYSVSVVTTVFFAALLAHAWVGLRDVILDYIDPMVFRVCLLVLLGFALTAVGAWIVRIFWMSHG